MLSENVFELITSSYVYLVKHIISGPLSLSWFAPFFLLPTALMISPKTMSQFQLICFFLVPIIAGIVHSWVAMAGVDVVSTHAVCWSLFLLGVNDPREDFKRVRYITPAHIARQDSKIQDKDTVAKQSINGAANDDYVRINERLETDEQQVVEKVASIFESPHHSPSQASMDDEAYPDELLPRFKWVLNLVFSTRLVRWKTGAPRHDSKQQIIHPTRLAYTLSITPLIVGALFTICVTSLMANHDPFFRDATNIPIASAYPTSSTPKPSTVIFFQNLLPPYMLRPLTLGIYTWALLTVEFNLLPVFGVYVNYLSGSRLPPDDWSPHTLPPYFGPFSALLDNGLRGAWGTWWHQHIRYFVMAPGLALIKVLNFPKSTPAAKVIIFISAFLFSGISHMGLIPPEPIFAKGGTSAMSMRLRIAAFFWVQPIGCLVESVVEKIVKDVLGDNDFFTRGIGRLIKRTVIVIWLLSSLSLTLRLPTVPYSELGLWDLPTIPIFPMIVQDFLMGKWLP